MLVYALAFISLVCMSNDFNNSTGATGYVGGDALYALHKKHPEFSFTVLTRDASKNENIEAAFPGIRIVNGELDDYELIKKEAAEADIVVRESPSLYLCLYL